MATANNNDTSTPELSECLILDTTTAYVHPDMGHLLQSLEKTQSAIIGKVAAGLRGYNLTGFSAKVYATPVNSSHDTPYTLRVQLEYDAVVKSGANHERVRSAHLDVASGGVIAKVERSRVAKPGT